MVDIAGTIDMVKRGCNATIILDCGRKENPVPHSPAQLLQCLLLASFLLLPGCLTSTEPILAEAGDVVVADLSGTYMSNCIN